jgi:hypothetical protein
MQISESIMRAAQSKSGWNKIIPVAEAEQREAP